MSTLSHKLYLRLSSSAYTKEKEAQSRVSAVIERLIDARSEYSRIGYPRAGGIDRLGIMLIGFEYPEINSSSTYWRMGRGYSDKSINKTPCHVKSALLRYFGDDKPNGLVVAWGCSSYGLMKYGALNKSFSEQEATIFISMLHNELCLNRMPNHFFGPLSKTDSGAIWNMTPNDSYAVGLCF